MKKTRRDTRSDEGGFALLLVFVMAAAIAITLYIEVPRIAFESQRTREQLTIDRALQYQRAIQLFYRKYQTYPQNLDDLETTRNIRFLRHRYMDPLTGKEWRLLHVGPAGQLTDSLVQPPPPLPGSTTGSGPNSAQGSSQGFGASQGFGSPQPQNSGQAATLSHILSAICEGLLDALEKAARHDAENRIHFWQAQNADSPERRGSS